MSSSTARSRCATSSLAVFALPLDLVDDRVLRLLLPVKQEDVLPQRIDLRLPVDAAAVVGLREELDVADQRQHGPARCRQHRLRHGVGLRHEVVARGHAGRDHLLQAAEHLLVLELLVGEAHHRLERHLIAEPVLAAEVQHLRADEAFHEREHVGVGSALQLREQAPFLGRQEGQLRGPGQAVGQERLAEIELAAADDVAVGVPADALGDLDALGVAGRVGREWAGVCHGVAPSGRVGMIRGAHGGERLGHTLPSGRLAVFKPGSKVLKRRRRCLCHGEYRW